MIESIQQTKGLSEESRKSELSLSGPREMISQGSTPNCEILTPEDKEQHAKSLSDADLLAKVEDTFRNWRENIPYIREARDRFAQPGRRIPVLGNPTWTEWVERHLGVGIRRVQQLLAADKEGGDGGRGSGSKTLSKPRFALAGLSETEVEEMVKRAAEIKPEVASRLMYKVLVQQPDLAEVRAVVTRCLGELSQAKQVEMLNELCDWVEGQIYDLEHPEEKPAPAPSMRRTFLDSTDVWPEPPTIIEKMEQETAMEVAAC
jgi:hypothetical protein